MKNFQFPISKKFVILHSSFIIVFALLLVPVVSLAYSIGEPLVPECSGNPGGCGWNELMAMVNNVITFTLIFMVVPIAAVMFAYAGFLMITAGEEAASAKTRAKNIFVDTVVGLIIALAAWLIVNLLLGILGWDGTWIGFKDVT